MPILDDVAGDFGGTNSPKGKNDGGEDVIDHYHALQRREAKWKADGFDPPASQTTDPWVSRNLWFQQLTHSVTSVRRINGPCGVKVPKNWYITFNFRSSTRSTGS